jgi:cell division protease FtsH
MVVEYGMSDVLGPMTYENRNRNMLGMQQPMDFDGQRLSEETRQEIDREVRRIVDEAHDRVRVLLNTERKALDAVAERLLEREVIEGDELVQILNEHAPKGRKRKRERSESN